MSDSGPRICYFCICRTCALVCIFLYVGWYCGNIFYWQQTLVFYHKTLQNLLTGGPTCVPHAHTRVAQRQYRTWKRNFRVIETSVHAYFVILLFIFTINNYNSGPFCYCFLLVCKSHNFNFICKILVFLKRKNSVGNKLFTTCNLLVLLIDHLSYTVKWIKYSNYLIIDYLFDN